MPHLLIIASLLVHQLRARAYVFHRCRVVLKSSGFRRRLCGITRREVSDWIIVYAPFLPLLSLHDDFYRTGPHTSPSDSCKHITVRGYDYYGNDLATVHVYTHRPRPDHCTHHERFQVFRRGVSMTDAELFDDG